MGQVPPHWLSYIACENVDASTTQARELGAKILAPPMDIPDVGRFSVVEDPAGSAFALFQGTCKE
jgi:predicted enzyme related to lactoylglutathione lyase